MIFLHKTLVFLSNCQVQEATLANGGTTQTSSCTILFLAFCEGAVIETKFFAKLDILLREHADAVETCILLHLRYGFAVRVAAMTQTRSKVSKKNRIYGEHIITRRVIEMSFVRNVVEVWQIFWKVSLRLPLLKQVLLFIPEPLGVDLTEVLD